MKLVQISRGLASWALRGSNDTSSGFFTSSNIPPCNKGHNSITTLSQLSHLTVFSLVSADVTDAEHVGAVGGDLKLVPVDAGNSLHLANLHIPLSHIRTSLLLFSFFLHAVLEVVSLQRHAQSRLVVSCDRRQISSLGSAQLQTSTHKHNPKPLSRPVVDHVALSKIHEAVSKHTPRVRNNDRHVGLSTRRKKQRSAGNTRLTLWHASLSFTTSSRDLMSVSTTILNLDTKSSVRGCSCTCNNRSQHATHCSLSLSPSGRICR